jgi:DNA-binding CsgD family transcriptional regulator
VEACALTERERAVTALVCQGCSTRQIAGRLFISEHTVQDHLNRSSRKVGVGSRRDLVAVLLTRQYLAAAKAGAPVGEPLTYSCEICAGHSCKECNELLRAVYAAVGPAAACAALDRFYRWCDGVQVAELSRLARTIRAWEPERPTPTAGLSGSIARAGIWPGSWR